MHGFATILLAYLIGAPLLGLYAFGLIALTEQGEM